MNFFALSHAHPEFDEEIAICTHDTITPARYPETAFGPNNHPNTSGVKITKTPGNIISFKLASVEILMHSSGFVSFSAYCFLTWSHILDAAKPTDFIVIAEKAYGIIAPTIRAAI